MPSEKALSEKNTGLRAFLKNPWLLLVSMMLGIYVGHTWHEFGVSLRVPGDLYLALLTMSVIPIISTSIITGLARMLRSGIASEFLGRMVALFVIMVLFSSGLGLLVGLVGAPGLNLGADAEAFLGRILLSETTVSGDELGLWGILDKMVPSNVFSAFSEGRILGVIFVSVLLGAALGVSSTESSERLLHTLEGFHEAFVRILSWVILGLPVGLFCMMGGAISTLGIESLFALSKFVLVFYAGGLVLAFIYFLVMRVATGYGFLQLLSALRDPLSVSFTAASCVAPIPIALNKMKRELKQPEAVCDVVIPLSVAMNRGGYAFLFSLTAVFLAQLLDKSLGFQDLMLVFFVSALVGTAAAGRSAAVGAILLFVLAPVGLPIAVAMKIYITIGAILDPLVQMLILLGGCSNATVVARVEGESEVEQEERKDPDEVTSGQDPDELETVPANR